MVIVDKENNSNPGWSVPGNNLSSSKRAEKPFVEIHVRSVYNTQSQRSVNPSCFLSQRVHLEPGRKKQVKSIFISRHLRQENTVMEKDVSKEETHSPLPPCRSCREAPTRTGPWTCVCSSRWDRSQMAGAWLKYMKKNKKTLFVNIGSKRGVEHVGETSLWESAEGGKSH